MLNIEYNGVPQESADATLDFLVNRPFLKIMFWFMQGSCTLLCVGFMITLYTNSAKPQDFVALAFALIWLFGYQSINRWLIKSNLKRVKFNDSKTVFKIDHKSIFCRLPFKNPFDVEWKKLKYILQNKDGYIIPLTGITNGGKFLWLPHRCFNSPETEQQFLDLAAKSKLKIKPLFKK